MSYQVFARKYRPQTFDDVLGQDHVVRTLRNAIEQNRLAHAYLFVGPRGTGKTSTARILAKALNCTGGPKIDFDPSEDVCREIADGNCLDVLEIDGASNRGIEEVRELRENVKFAPARGPYKIYYIDEVHMLTPQAFNALLKTLEEPPAHVKFIFATTEPTKILPTIISRCQRFDLRRIPEKIIANHLLYIARNENVTLEEDAAYAIAKGAEGGMRDAQSMLDQLVAFCGNTIKETDVLEIFGFTGHEVVANLSEDILTGNTANALNHLHEQSELGKDLAKLLDDLISHLRNVLVIKVDPQAASASFSDALSDSLAEQGALVETDRLLRLIDVFAETGNRMKWAANKKLHFEVGIIRGVQTLSESSISDVISFIDQSLDGAPPPQRKESKAPSSPKLKKSPAASTDNSTPPKSQPPASQSSTPKSTTPKTEPAPTPEPAPAPAGNLSGQPLWNALTALVDKKRPIASAWLKAGRFARIDGRYFVIAFSESDAFARDNITRPNNKSLIEELIKELSGQPLSLKTEINRELPPSSPEPAPAPAPAAEPPSQPDPGPKPEPEPAPTEAEKPSPAKPTTQTNSPAADKEGDFKDDPLIKEALDLFKAEIK